MKQILLLAITVLIAEVGCLLRSTALCLQYGKMTVLIGTMIGALAAAIIGIYLAEPVKHIISPDRLDYVGGGVLILLGLYMIFGHGH